MSRSAIFIFGVYGFFTESSYFQMRKDLKDKFPLPSQIWRGVIPCLLIGLALFVYWDIQNHKFLNFDDNIYVSSNPHVKNGLSIENVRWAFTFTDVSYWHPVTFLSHMLDSQFFGLAPGPHLLVNLALHMGNALLLYFIFLGMTGARFKAALVASLFAVHPLNVESVAWLAERKTVLSTLMMLAAMQTYIRYTKTKEKRLYIAVLLLFAIGLMSKPSILTFPVLLLVLDYWPLKRFSGPVAGHGERPPFFSHPVGSTVFLCRSDAGRIVLEKAPFFLLSALSTFMTMASALHNELVINDRIVPLVLRVYNLFVSVVEYLRLIAWPVELSIFYPLPRTMVVSHFLSALAAVVFITLAAFALRGKRPWLIAGWTWFLVALSPASGLIQAGLWPAIANRFMYIPMIGLFMMLIWEGDGRLKGRYSGLLKALLCGAMLVYFGSLARIQNTYFSNSFALFSRSLEVVGDNELALNNLGEALSSLGRADEALACFARSIRRNPAQANAYHNYGVCLVAKGNEADAVPYFQKAIALNAKLITPRIHLGLVLSHRGENDAAVELLEQALNIDPDHLDAHNNYGTILATRGRFAEAISHYTFVLTRDPSYTPARINLSQAYEEAGRFDEAMAEYETLDRTISHDKGFIYYRMARVRSQQKRFDLCAGYLERAVKDGFRVREVIGSDKGFAPFRKTQTYRRFIQ